MKVEEAFLDFVKDIKIGELHKMAQFMDVVPNTILVWLDKGFNPQGATLIRLQHYLFNQGYELQELKSLQRPAFQLGQIIAFGLVSIDDLVQRLGYTNTTAVYRMAQGSGFVYDRAQLLKELIKEYEDVVQEAVANFPRRQRSQAVSPEQEPSVLVRQVELAPATAPLSKSWLSSSVLAVGLVTSLELLENMLDLIELEPGGLEAVANEIQQRKLEGVVERLMPLVG